MALHWLTNPILRRIHGTESSEPDTLPPEHVDGTEYRLIKWPDLPDALHTADVMGALSVMTQQPVTAHWFAYRVKWQTWKTIEFLERLCIAGDACQVAGPGANTPEERQKSGRSRR